MGILRCRMVLAGMALLAAGAREVGAAERYVAWLADGTRVTAKALTAWPLPGNSFRLENREILDTENAARFIRDRDAWPLLKPPYLVMSNGDVVPGALVQLEPADGRVGLKTRVQVELESPLAPVVGSTLSVAANRVARIVVAPHAGAMKPGVVRLLDGRQLTARAIRWRERGLALLTAEGIVEVEFADIAEAVFPVTDQNEAVLADQAWGVEGHRAAIGRIQTKGGAALTAARISREQDSGRRRGRLSSEVLYYVQPAWADEPLAIPEDEIAACGYRAADEVPLSCLTATTVANRRVIGPVEAWTANRSARGGMLAAGGLEADVGIAAHSYSEIAFDLPSGARSLELAVGLVASEGGCVRCKVMTGDGASLWDAGVFQGQDGVRRMPVVDVTGVKRVVLVTDAAHDERPKGADPFDIRDSVVWLEPLVKLDASLSDPKRRLATMLPEAADWEFVGDGWQRTRVASRWNLLASTWYPAIVQPAGNVLSLERKLRVSRENDVVELFTVCPADLEEHEFQLTVNGAVVPWHNNADRNQLRQWTARYSKQRARDGSAEESNLSDRLAYWWDLQAWRGQEVELRLQLSGKREVNEIVCRGLSVRSAIGNLLPGDGPRKVDVPLSGVAVQSEGNFLQTGPVRLLGQEFKDGLSLARNGNVRWSLKPEFKTFVAVVGCTSQVAGPVQLLVDDQIVWERASINCLSPAEQIAIPLPGGAKTLTLRSGAEAPFYGTVAVVEAGFVVK